MAANRLWPLAGGRAHIASVILTALALCGCAAPSSIETGALAPATSTSPHKAGKSAELAAAHKANAGDIGAALAYARALRSEGAKAEALAALDETAVVKRGDRRLTLERGLLALELGQPEKAETLLRQAHDAKAPDWRLHSALGAALASRGKQQEAQAQFAKALALAPDQPAVLNNLALSYALDGRTEEAEKLLRKAQTARSSAPQVAQNLALVLGLRGKFDEAKSAVANGALSPAKADANVSYLQSLTAKKAEADGISAPRKASASLAQPTYQLGGPKPE
jgi:Flp pilus assembly protein TadD